jgi:hypothetical protein
MIKLKIMRLEEIRNGNKILGGKPERKATPENADPEEGNAKMELCRRVLNGLIWLRIGTISAFLLTW